MRSSEGVDRVTETVLVRYWAGARAAAGVDEERLSDVATVGDLVARLTEAHPALAPVLPVCSAACIRAGSMALFMGCLLGRGCPGRKCAAAHEGV